MQRSSETPGRRGGGIPTARYVEHAGFTVSDLEEAVAFFVDVLGCELLYRAGPYYDPEGGLMESRLGLHRQTAVRVAVLRCGPTENVELIQLGGPEERGGEPSPSDAVGKHLAFAVEDFEAAGEYLALQPGVTAFPPLSDGEDDGRPEGGQRTRFFRTTFGMYVEIIQRPEHLRYEDEGSARLYRPETSWWSR